MLGPHFPTALYRDVLAIFDELLFIILSNIKSRCRKLLFVRIEQLLELLMSFGSAESLPGRATLQYGHVVCHIVMHALAHSPLGQR